MPKTPPSAGATDRLDDEVQYLAYLLRIARTDGTIHSVTDHDGPLDFNDGLGLLTYSPDEGASTSAIASLFDSTVDELDVTAFIGSGLFDYNDVIAGRFDAAEIRAYLVNWNDLADGGWKMRRGNVGNVDFDEGKVRFQLLGMIQKMHSTSLVELISSACRVKKFGDHDDLHPRCKIELDAAVWQATTDYSAAGSIRLDESAGDLAGTEEVVVRPTSFNDRWFVMTTAGTSGGSEPSWNTTIGGTTSDSGVTWTTIQARRILGATITTVTNHMQLVLTGYSGDAPNAFLQGGKIIFNAGENVNIERPIASWDLGTLTVTLALPLNLVAVSTESVTLVAGCDRLITTCVNTYDNLHNFRGDPYLRGKDAFFTFPDAPPA
jgi:uncharacterized phage protein (TIGR02218 family)